MRVAYTYSCPLGYQNNCNILSAVFFFHKFPILISSEAAEHRSTFVTSKLNHSLTFDLPVRDMVF